MKSLVDSWDYFSILLHAFMLETGFKIRNDGHQKKSNCLSFQYELASQEKSLAHCSVNVQRIVGPITKVIGNFHGTDERESFVLTKNSIADVIEEKTFNFKNFKNISKEFKDQISLPLLVKMQESHGVPAPSTVLQFPDEILIKIAENLSDAKTSRSFAKTCRRFREISFDTRLMKALLRKHFPKKYVAAVQEHADPDWYQLYMAALKEEMAKNRRARDIEDNQNHFWFPPGFPFGPGFPPAPGFPPGPGFHPVPWFPKVIRDPFPFGPGFPPAPGFPPVPEFPPGPGFPGVHMFPPGPGFPRGPRFL